MLPRSFAIPLILGITASCAPSEDNAPQVATPSVTLGRASTSVGGPLEMTYRFAVAQDAPPFAEDLWVFVHFLDTDGELMWTDDHEPPTPSGQWKPGQTITYSRTVFVPKFPYVGRADIDIGIFSRRTGERISLKGESQGQRSYRVASFDLLLPSDMVVVVYKDGWHSTEEGGNGREWQWSKKQGILAFRNPKKNVVLYLEMDRVAAPLGAQVDVKIGDSVFDTFALAPDEHVLRKIRLSPEQLGPADTIEATITVDRTFVPAAIPELKSNDPRELGVRVFKAFIEPQP